ncbi:TRAP transporter small permease [Propionivibrio soli]|uniref:TRAP transporter small permease n=1 Tax=Propionivibrio soli TaxID=2976531 RepID=UPI0021E97F44|nr:TRAP transporter small permease [Propionivibrio soli]
MGALNRLIHFVEWILVGMFGVMAILVFGNVVLRYGFNSGIVFSEEVARFMFMWLTLIGALMVMKDHGHLGMSSVVSHFGEAGQRICRFLADLMTLICCLLLAHGTWKQMIIGMDDHAPVTGIPMGIVQSALLISSVGMSFVLGYGLWRLVTRRMKADELVPFSGSVGE